MRRHAFPLLAALLIAASAQAVDARIEHARVRASVPLTLTVSDAAGKRSRIEVTLDVPAARD